MKAYYLKATLNGTTYYYLSGGFIEERYVEHRYGVVKLLKKPETFVKASITKLQQELKDALQKLDNPNLQNWTYSLECKVKRAKKQLQLFEQPDVIHSVEL